MPLYDYNEANHQAFVVNWFEGFSGYVHTDADSFFNKLYAVEKKAKSERLNPDEIKQLRQKHAKQLLETFKTWLENKIGLVPQQSPIFIARVIA